MVILSFYARFKPVNVRGRAKKKTSAVDGAVFSVLSFFFRYQVGTTVSHGLDESQMLTVLKNRQIIFSLTKAERYTCGFR